MQRIHLRTLHVLEPVHHRFLTRPFAPTNAAPGKTFGCWSKNSKCSAKLSLVLKMSYVVHKRAPKWPSSTCDLKLLTWCPNLLTRSKKDVISAAEESTLTHTRPSHKETPRPLPINKINNYIVYICIYIELI